MGLFDEITCRYPLPLEGANALVYQTKDTPEQWIDRYEIREDGTLWHEAYDVEDRSDPGKEGLSRLIGSRARMNQRWEPVRLTGEIRFYTDKPRWIEWSAYFVNGVLNQVHLLPEESGG